MKIVFITREGFRLPGARIRCYAFAREIAKYGINAEVLSFSDTLGAKDGEKESEMGLTEKIGLNCRALKMLNKEKNTILVMQRFNYHSLSVFLSHYFNKNKIILDLDDWEMRDDPRYLFGFYPTSKAYHFTKYIARRSIFCIAASRFLERFLLQFNKNVLYVPSGVDTGLFKPALSSISLNRVTISWIGTLHKREYIENLKLALSCFSVLRKKFSHIYFEILGDGIYKSALEEIISQHNDRNILFKSWINPDNVPEYLLGIDIGIFPVAQDNKFNRSKSPTKLFEYMAMKKPTVSSNIGETAHIIKDGYNGFLAKTTEEFIQKMQVLIQEPNLRQQIGEEAYQTVKANYSLEVIVKRLYEALKTIRSD